ncbi:MAG TPA: FAD:protein FMN transferase [Candidatus Acidoferrum sp.]|nr:FAD:protein FMN transferase [Candidatus Acidoferrum sp.]
MASEKHGSFSLTRCESYWAATFSAMASPSEILIRSDNESEVQRLASLAYFETDRIESKFSRYRDDNIVFAINHSDGQEISLDQETADLLRYAGQCYELSDGLFDVTSGILRKAWTFNGGPVTPDKNLIDSLLPSVGWDKIALRDHSIVLKPGMEIDLGGLGKEYAVDRVADLLYSHAHVPLLVNFGGDLRAMSPEGNKLSWQIGIEDPESEGTPVGVFELRTGGAATSGVSHRHCWVNGVKLGHILDPRTGWPVAGAPRSVTVLARFCLEAGLLTTLAMLQGSEAESFLQAQGVTHHCIR